MKDIELDNIRNFKFQSIMAALLLTVETTVTITSTMSGYGPSGGIHRPRF